MQNSSETVASASSSVPEFTPVSDLAPEPKVPSDGHVHGPDCHHHHHDHEAQVPYVRAGAKVGRNDLCPCGSGKKFKKCCL